MVATFNDDLDRKLMRRAGGDKGEEQETVWDAYRREKKEKRKARGAPSGPLCGLHWIAAVGRSANVWHALLLQGSKKRGEAAAAVEDDGGEGEAGGADLGFDDPFFLKAGKTDLQARAAALSLSGHCPMQLMSCMLRDRYRAAPGKYVLVHSQTCSFTIVSWRGFHRRRTAVQRACSGKRTRLGGKRQKLAPRLRRTTQRRCVPACAAAAPALAAAALTQGLAVLCCALRYAALCCAALCLLRCAVLRCGSATAAALGWPAPRCAYRRTRHQTTKAQFEPLSALCRRRAAARSWSCC